MPPLRRVRVPRRERTARSRQRAFARRELSNLQGQVHSGEARATEEEKVRGSSDEGSQVPFYLRPRAHTAEGPTLRGARRDFLARRREHLEIWRSRVRIPERRCGKLPWPASGLRIGRSAASWGCDNVRSRSPSQSGQSQNLRSLVWLPKEASRRPFSRMTRSSRVSGP